MLGRVGLRASQHRQGVSNRAVAAGAGESDPAAAILGAILGEVLKDKSAGGGGAASPGSSSRAVIYTRAGITNASALGVDFWVSESTGGLEVGVYQRRYDGPGYHLRINLSGRPPAELTRASVRGRGVVDSYSQPVELKDGKPHRIDWTRASDGRMAVSVDGKAVMKGADRSFCDPWDGVVLVNHGGDFTTQRITVDGTR